MSFVRRSAKLRRRTIRYSLIAINIIFLAAVITFFIAYNGGDSSGNLNISAVGTAATADSDPLDQISSADIAVSVASMVNLPETTAVQNQAETVSAELAITPAENLVAAKPQIVATALKTRQDIQTYVVQTGDTLGSLATKFNITSSSIVGSNRLVSTTLVPGTKLVIPPVSGIVYTVKAGDTAQGLAQTYDSSAAAITSFNDAEISGLIPGEVIVIPGGQQPIAPIESYGIYGGVAEYNGNGYDFGYCTWYVATQITVPSNWGNADTWAYYARQDGWDVSSIPTVGAVAQTAAGSEGHVAVVRVVNGDGTIWISEMNSYGQVSMTNSTPAGGWDRVDWKKVSISDFQNYITR